MNEIMPVISDEEIEEREDRYALRNVPSLVAQTQNKADRKWMVGWIEEHQWQGHKTVGFGPPKGYRISEKELQALKEAIDE